MAYLECLRNTRDSRYWKCKDTAQSTLHHELAQLTCDGTVQHTEVLGRTTKIFTERSLQINTSHLNYIPQLKIYHI